jgi:hypothetical protein
MSRMEPSLTSTFPSLKWAPTAQADVATIELHPEAAEMVGGTPIIISRGVRRNPPPTPVSPESRPMSEPAARRGSRLALIPAMGRKTGMGDKKTLRS